MWVTFTVKKTANNEVVLVSYQQDDDERQLPGHVSTPELIELVLQKAKLSPEELLSKGSAKVNIQLSAFEDLVLKPSLHHLDRPDTSASTVAIMMESLQLQQQQVAQQTELMGAIVSALRAPQRPRFELVKPDIFDGFSSSAEAWIDFM
ncbi:hypothetical protein HPB47_019254, partial [Ixodes persulcatus]